MRASAVIEMDPVANDAAGVLQGFETVAMSALLFQCPDQAFDQSVLLGRMWRNGACAEFCVNGLLAGNYVSWKRRPEVAADLKRIYQSATAEEAEQHLGEFEAKWDDDYLPIGQSWRRNWVRLIPFFDYAPEIRKVIYTTNAIESVNMSLRTLTKNRGSFPSDEALMKLFYLALRNISQKWTMPIRDWKAALTRFTIQFEERIPQA